MKKIGIVMMALMTGGCALMPPPQVKSPDLAWLSAPAATAVPTPQKPVKPSSVRIVEVDSKVAEGPLGDTGVGKVEDIVLIDPASASGEEELLSDDAETLEDNQSLSEDSLEPPENEGETVSSQDGTFDFPVVMNEKVGYYIRYFSDDAKESFNRWLERSGRYLPMMVEIIEEEGIPRDLAYLAMIESGFNERAYSVAHAVGPWQFIESTGTLMGLKNDWWRDERRDFAKSTRAAARFLRELKDKFNGDWYLALAAYNAGPGKIQRGIDSTTAQDYWALSRADYLPKETKNYVPKLLAALHIAKNPSRYGFPEVDYQRPLQYDTVEVPTVTDLEVVARLCGVNYEQIKQLNPELKRWCTPPGEKHYAVRIPTGTRERFQKAFASLPASERSNYRLHKIKSGDTLKSIAKKYSVRSEDIVSANRIADPRRLTVGMELLLPLKPGLSRVAVDSLKDDYVRSRSKTYTLQRGDSLWKVSKKFGVSERDLRDWNGLGRSAKLTPGQVLIVSGKAPASGRAAASKVSALNRQPGTKRIVYQVQSGDTLWGIGRQFAVETDQIMSWNNLTGESVLRPGDELTLLVRLGQSRG